MSLATTVGAGALLGTVLAVGVYTAVAPADQVPASVEVAPTYDPVPTPTVTVEAEDCESPAVLEDDECVVHEPGPTVTVTPTAVPAPAPATHRSEPTREYGDDDSQGEDDGRGEYEHEDADHEDSDDDDSEHEDADHEDHDDDGGEHDDD